jgi:hypothetical protein
MEDRSSLARVGAAAGCDLLILFSRSKDRSLRQLLHGDPWDYDTCAWADCINGVPPENKSANAFGRGGFLW